MDLATYDADLLSVVDAGLRVDSFTSAASVLSGVLLVLVIGRIMTFTRR